MHEAITAARLRLFRLFLVSFHDDACGRGRFLVRGNRTDRCVRLGAVIGSTVICHATPRYPHPGHWCGERTSGST